MEQIKNVWSVVLIKEGAREMAQWMIIYNEEVIVSLHLASVWVELFTAILIDVVSSR